MFDVFIDWRFAVANLPYDLRTFLTRSCRNVTRQGVLGFMFTQHSCLTLRSTGVPL